MNSKNKDELMLQFFTEFVEKLNGERNIRVTYDELRIKESINEHPSFEIYINGIFLKK